MMLGVAIRRPAMASAGSASAALDSMRTRPAVTLRRTGTRSPTGRTAGLMEVIHHAVSVRVVRSVLPVNVIADRTRWIAVGLELARGGCMGVLAPSDHPGGTAAASCTGHAEKCPAENRP